MKDSTAMAMAMFGLLLTMFGVGGVENSMTNVELFSGLAVSVVGLGIMACGTLALRRV
jgi:hypothetical protein